MANNNIDRFTRDLKDLMERGEALRHSMMREVLGKEHFDDEFKKVYGEEKGKKKLATLPEFRSSYDLWYTEAIAVIRQILPDRLDDFVDLYKKPANRKNISYGNYVIQDYLQSLVVRHPYGEEKVGLSAALPQFEQQLSILSSSQRRFDSSLFDIRQTLEFEIFEDELEAARHLLSRGFLRASGVIAGVLLERHLKQICTSRGAKLTKKNPTIADLNDALKSKDIIEIDVWRKIAYLGDLRNICSHDRSQDPSKEQVKDLIDGTQKIASTIN